MAGHGKSLRKARVRWFSDKPKKPKRKSTRASPRQIIALRLRDLAKLFRGRYGHVLPDDDAGRDDLVVALNHLACLPHPQKAIERWVEIWAPWLTIGEKKDLIGPIIASPQRWKADELAWRLHLTAEDRSRLGITTIGAIDENRAARVRRRQQTAKDRMTSARRARGAKPRHAWLETSIERSKPWEEEGISRRTWYRRQREVAQPGTGPCAP